MKVFSTAPEGNEIAQYVGIDYLKFSISLIEEDCIRMKKNDGIAQPLLANIDLLLTIAGKYPAYANLIIKKSLAQEWKDIFFDWFERCKNNIPVSFRAGIKANGSKLFKKLEQYGQD